MPLWSGFQRPATSRARLLGTGNRMANEEHVALLLRSTREWNLWRRKNKRIRPDLDQAELGGADLREANLKGADLSGAILTGADLSGSWMWGANLDGADLSGADLTDVQFGLLSLIQSLRLSWRGTEPPANPHGANLSGANLEGVRGLTQGQLSASATYAGAENLPSDIEPDTR